MLRKTTTAIVLLAVFLMMIAGCTAARRPEPNDVTPEPGTDGGRSPSGLKAQAEQVRAAAEEVKGVNRAYAVVVGNIVLVGIDVAGDMNDRQSNTVKEQVASQIENDPRYVEAYVTADPELVARVRNIANGIASGKPITQFLDEVSDVLQALRPES